MNRFKPLAIELWLERRVNPDAALARIDHGDHAITIPFSRKHHPATGCRIETKMLAFGTCTVLKNPGYFRVLAKRLDRVMVPFSANEMLCTGIGPRPSRVWAWNSHRVEMVCDVLVTNTPLSHLQDQNPSRDLLLVIRQLHHVMPSLPNNASVFKLGKGAIRGLQEPGKAVGSTPSGTEPLLR
ncbi:hypothetical protein CEE69_29825 [Rhodopirellula bahusiensis]|uniref:Uncharacterized protein n=1 Tax=Rhodopirellula bahusiensis TaxID=2014065 RepID=A0A2G1VY38_9BACT|nr:hypothetical protein CEE69_29825 [Rhodopirellula bahusiensis]